MLVNEVNERIKVGAVFDGNRVTPRWFFRGNAKHQIKKVEHCWRSREGETPLLFFAVTDGANVYELKLNQKTLEWRLEKVYMQD
jgi:hypothetical protein